MAEGDRPGYRVLIVDDSPQITTLLASCLADLATIAVAEAGDAALRQAVEFKPHLMLVDIVLPGFSGFDLVDMLRRRPGGIDAHVVFMTGLQEPANAYRARELGARAMIYKPLDPEHVRRVVTQLLYASGT